MKIFSKMLTRKPEPEERVADFDLEDLEPLKRRIEASADDSGKVNPTRRTATSRPTSTPLAAHEEEPDTLASGWGSAEWDDDDWDDDDDWGDDAFDAEERRRSKDKEHLVSEIRDAMNSVRPRFADDEPTGRRARARSQLLESNEAEARILEKTETAMEDHETSRRRSAMAHLKAAAATKADSVLQHVAARDPSADPEEQSPYRDDLAKVVRPHATSRPISRQVSKPRPAQAAWDQGAGDEDAALYAASNEDDGADDWAEAELSEEEERRLSRAPVALSEEDFADDTTFGGGFDDDYDDEIEEAFPASPFAAKRTSRTEDSVDPFASEDDFAAEDSFDDDDDDEDFAPRASSVVSDAVAFANGDDDALDDHIEPEERKKIWEMADDVASEIEKTRQTSEDAPNFVNVSAPVVGRAGRSAGRVKTRLLGFQADDGGPGDVFAATEDKPADKPEADAGPAADFFPVGWIFVLDGPGRGACFSLHSGVSQIGRGHGQAVRLDFGDTSISRNNHAAVAFDEEQNTFFLGHGGKSNLVRLNGKPVLSTEEMSNGDEIRIGETTLKFVALCGEEFSWNGTKGDNGADA